MNLIANPSATKNVWQTETKSYCNESTDFHDEAIPQVGSNYNCLAVVYLILF